MHDMTAGYYVAARMTRHGIAPIIDANVSAGNDIACVVHYVAARHNVATRVTRAILLGRVSEGTGGDEPNKCQNNYLFHGEDV